MIPYNSFVYLWPPRPKTSIKPFSDHFEKMKTRAGWISQIKKNGQRNVLYVSPDREVQWWNRHGDHHLNFKPPEWLVNEVLACVPETGKWMAIDGEILHNKDASVKNTLYWWDILVFDGQYMLGTTYGYRHSLLTSLTCSKPLKETDTEIWITDNISVAKNIQQDRYDEMWKLTETSYVEGFVFKNLMAKLSPCIKEQSNGEWQVRCRRKSNSYRF